MMKKTNEILDKNYSQWTYTDTLKANRWYGQSVVLMQDYNVMIIGGFKGSITDPSKRDLKECEIFSYLERTWEVTAELNTGRYYHTSTLLQDGRILVAGGETINNGVVILNSCEIFNPTTRSWTIAEPMRYSRTGHSATLLNNGRVLIIGGGQANSELYDPLTNTWEEVGKVFLASGLNDAIVLCNEEYVLLIHDIIGYTYRPGWDLYSLKELKSVFWGELSRLINDPVIVKIDENRVLFSGGHEFIEEYSLFTPSNFCRLYDLNLISVREENKYDTLPNVFSLSCYPNPFNSAANITIELSFPEFISLIVYNTIGEEVDVIYKGELDIGKHIFQYSMNNHSSGVYFIRMYSSKKEKLIKVIYQK